MVNELVKKIIRERLSFVLSPVEAGQEAFCRSCINLMQGLQSDMDACEKELAGMMERIRFLESKVAAMRAHFSLPFAVKAPSTNRKTTMAPT